MKKLLTALPAIALFLFSCQKEISFENIEPGTNPSGGANGDLLVKAYEITVPTNDTNTITFLWDDSRRLLQYHSLGKVNSARTYINHRISRGSDGKINEIISRTEIDGALSDSAVYTVHYLPNSTKMAYAFGEHVGAYLDYNDSTVYTYNSAGMISSKEAFSDLLGDWEPAAKEEYTYDANGNLIKIVSYISDFNGGWLQGGLTTYTYSSHKAAIALGEECYIVMNPSVMSKNNMVGMTTNAVSSGTNYSIVVSQQQFNSFDRPTQELMHISPQPPAYDIRIFYYYQ
jgi:YD repeat-containing protein